MLAWELAPHGPVVAIGRPGRGLASLGAARDHLPDDVWREGVTDGMNVAGAIVVVIGATDGLAWEIGQIARGSHLAKTIFVFPPTDDVALHHRWAYVDAILDELGSRPTSLPVDAALPLTAQQLPPGQWSVTVATYRDEASYCAGVDVAMRAASDTTALLDERGVAAGG